MNMDYSKAFELLNQDAEKERNKKAEKAVHDNLYNKGFRDGIAILDKIRAEIERMIPTYHNPDWSITDLVPISEVLKLIDKYKPESEEKE